MTFNSKIPNEIIKISNLVTKTELVDIVVPEPVIDEKISSALNFIYEKYVVVGVWGQSNAVGYDESLLTKYDVAKDINRVFQYSDTLKPLSYCAENLQNMNTNQARTTNNERARMAADRSEESAERQQYTKTKGIHLPLANLILDAIPDDYAVIIVPGGFGGQALYRFQKNDSSGFYTNFINRMKSALDLHPDNILSGIVWCQGENDCGTAGSTYVNNFQTLVNNVNSDLASYANRTSKRSLTKDDWYFYEWPAAFKDSDSGGILIAMKEFMGEKNYIEIPYETPYNLTTYTAANVRHHYAQNSFRTIIAPRVFNKMQQNGAFLCNKFDANTHTVYQTSELENEIELLREKDTILQATVNNLLAKVNELAEKLGSETVPEEPIKTWRAVTETDFAWYKENHGNSSFSDGKFICGSGDQASGIYFNKDIEEIRFVVSDETTSDLPAFIMTNLNEETGGHNNIFICSTKFVNNGHFWVSNTISDSFNGMPYDATFELAEFVEHLPKETVITFKKLSDTTFSVTANGETHELDITTRNNYIQNSVVRFGFNNCWTRMGKYVVKDIEVLSY